MNEDLKARCDQLDANGGLTARALWESAADPADPLHNMFEWDNDAAAAKWRDEQARGYISGMRLQVTVSERVLSVPVYVRDVTKEDNEPGYVRTASLANHADRAKKTVLRETAFAAAALHRARSIAASLHCTDPLDELIEKLTRYRETL